MGAHLALIKKAKTLNSSVGDIMHRLCTGTLLVGTLRTVHGAAMTLTVGLVVQYHPTPPHPAPGHEGRCAFSSPLMPHIEKVHCNEVSFFARFPRASS